MYLVARSDECRWTKRSLRGVGEAIATCTCGLRIASDQELSWGSAPEQSDSGGRLADVAEWVRDCKVHCST